MASLVSLADYKVYAGYGAATTYDAVHTVMLGMASAMVRRHCGRDEDTGFATAARTEFYSGTGGETIQLREYPVTTLTSVESKDDADAYTTLVAATDYRFTARTGLLYRKGTLHGRFADGTGWGPSPCWVEGNDNFRVIYTAGYSTIPADLVLAVCKLVDLMFAERKAGGAMQSESIGGYSYTRATQEMKSESMAAMLAPFRGGSL